MKSMKKSVSEQPLVLAMVCVEIGYLKVRSCWFVHHFVKEAHSFRILTAAQELVHKDHSWIILAVPIRNLGIVRPVAGVGGVRMLA